MKRFNFFRTNSTAMSQVIDRTDVNLDPAAEGFWTCLTDHICAGSFDTLEIGAPAKHQLELFFARQDSPIAREIMPEVGRAKSKTGPSTTSTLSLASSATTADDPFTTTCPSSWPRSSSGSARNTSLRRRATSLTASIFTNVPQPLFGTAAVDKATKLFRGILQDFAFVDPGRAWAGVGLNNRK